MIARLTLTDFRNHAAALVEPGPGGGFVLLSGPNGAGKTNILEAVSLLTPGRGLRQVPISEMARSDGPGGFGVAATLNPRPFRGGEEPLSGEGAGEVSLGTGTIPTAPDRRQVRINGAAASVNSLAEWLSVLWLTPAMDRLFAESASGRRRFLDRLVLALDPAHAKRSSRYDAAMRARNKLLAEPTSEWDYGWLDALEAQMGELGEAISLTRLTTIKALVKVIWEVPGEDFPKSRLLLDQGKYEGLKARLGASRLRDAAARRATHGPNNEDLLVYYGGRERLASQCSTGEQKALLLGIVLAHAELVAQRRGAPPILLLDEVAAHLDPARRAALFTRLDGRGQVWMTATEANLFADIGSTASRFHVASGTILSA